MPLIREISTSRKQIPHKATSALIQVAGDSDAVFSLKVARSSDGRYYNFETSVFEAAYTSKSRLANLNPGSFNVDFPRQVGGDTYTAHVFAEPHFDTKLNFGANELYYSTIITQRAIGTITLATDTSISTVNSTAIGTSIGSVIDRFSGISRPTVVMNDLKLDLPLVAGNHGVFITSPTITSEPKNGTWDASALYWSTVAADHETTSASSHDAGATSTALVLNNIDGLHIGMHVAHIETVGALATMPTITAIDIDTLTVTLSAAQTWDTAKEITFRAYGSNLIKKAIGIGIELTYATCRLGQESTTVKTAIASGTPTALVVFGSQGISKDATVRGKFVDNSSNTNPCSISSISSISGTANSTINITQGVFAATTTATFNPPLGVNIPIRVGTVLYVDGSSADVYLSGTISISKYPAVVQNIFVDISKIFTIGTAS